MLPRDVEDGSPSVRVLIGQIATSVLLGSEAVSLSHRRTCTCDHRRQHVTLGDTGRVLHGVDAVA